MLLFIASKSHHQCQLLLSESCLFLSPAYLCKTMTQTIASLLKNEHHVFLRVIVMKTASSHAMAAIRQTLGSDIWDLERI